jgi:hypothetical protein
LSCGTDELLSVAPALNLAKSVFANAREAERPNPELRESPDPVGIDTAIAIPIAGVQAWSSASETFAPALESDHPACFRLNARVCTADRQNPSVDTRSSVLSPRPIRSSGMPAIISRSLPPSARVELNAQPDSICITPGPTTAGPIP